MANVITTKEERLFTAEEADKYIRNMVKGVNYTIMASAFLPTVEEGGELTGSGFEGMAFISVSREEFRRVMRRMLSPTLEGRGGRIKLRFEPADPTYRSARPTVSLY